MNGFQFGRPSSFPSKRSWFLVICLAILTGCGGPYISAPVKVDVARKTLVSTMESWKGGETPDGVRKKSPSVVVQDMDWTNGAKLIEYEILGDGKPVDANLIAKVKLKLSGADGKETVKTVTYVVGTSPVLTVFRDIMN